VKRNHGRIDLTALKTKAQKLLSSYPGCHVEWLALWLVDIGSYLPRSWMVSFYFQVGAIIRNVGK